jgi:NDP-sugar pyrophosphorylase family protein
MSLPVAILAGGMATRLRPLTERIPKSLIPVAGRPFVAHQVELLRKNGLGELVFCLGHLGPLIEKYLGDGTQFHVKIRYSYDGPDLLGTGGALRKALPLLGPRFFVLYGDSYLDINYGQVERAFEKSKKLGLMSVMRNEGKWDRSNVVLKEGRILKYDKRERSPEMQYIDYGLGAFQAEAIRGYPQPRKLDLESIYQDLLKRNELAAFEIRERFFEIGSEAGLAQLEEYLRTKSRPAGR